MRDKNKPSLPIRVEKILRKLGGDLKSARRRRSIPINLMAERAMISRSTLIRIEKGSPEVSIGFYATVLYILGLEDNFAKIADIKNDDLGASLDEERLPKRIHRKKKIDQND